MSSPLPKATTKKKKENEANDINTNKKQKKVAAALVAEIIPKMRWKAQTKILKDDDDEKKRRFTAVAFNVAGLRALLKNKPECLRKIADETKCDAMMFSEHKLNPENVEEATRQLKELLPEFTTVKFACSTAKKGYAGVCVLAKGECEDARKKEGGKSPMKQTSIKDMFGGGASEKKKEAPIPTNDRREAIRRTKAFKSHGRVARWETSLGRPRDYFGIRIVQRTIHVRSKQRAKAGPFGLENQHVGKRVSRAFERVTGEETDDLRR